MLRRAGTGGRPESSICTVRTDFKMLKTYRTNVIKVIKVRNFENIFTKNEGDIDQSVANYLVVEKVAEMLLFEDRRQTLKDGQTDPNI